MALTKITRGVIKANENYDTHNINSTGIVTAVSANFTGNVSIGGTLTYQDVTNIDSVGIVTARAGVNISGGNLQVKGGNLHLDSNAELALFEDNTSGTYTNSAKIAFDFSGNIARMRSSTNGSATVRPLAFYITNTPAIFVGTDGKVGINETSPTAHLVVKQSGNTFTTQSQTVALFQRSSTAGHGAKIAIVAGTGGSSDINFGDTADEDIGSIQYYHTDNSFRFTTNTTERLRITSAGKVGVGENSPDRLLHLKAASSTAYSGGSDTADYNFLKIENTTNDKSAGIFFQIGGNGEGAITATEVADGNTDICFQNRGGGVRSEKLRITSGGKIGVGVASPSEMMEISNTGSTGSQIQLRDTSTGTGAGDGVRFGYNGSGAQIWNFENTYTRFATNNVERFRLTSDGKFGFNTTNPGAFDSGANHLVLLGNTSGTGNAGITIASGTGSYGNIYFADGTSGADAYRGHIAYNHNGNTMRFATNGTERVRIDASGRVTKPYQPSAMAYNAQGQFLGGGSVAQFNSTKHNIGNMYNSSNGRMTVPVAGTYLVAYSGLHDYISQAAVGFDVRINGSQFDGGEGYQESNNISNSQLAKTLILYLNANDYVEIYIRSSGTRVHQRYGSFSVCLLT